MNAKSENGQLAKQILDEYYRGFQERNPYLYVFSAHLHIDEATPHLHTDFVPFTTGSKRGLDTRVSLKQALAARDLRVKIRVIPNGINGYCPKTTACCCDGTVRH